MNSAFMYRHVGVAVYKPIVIKEKSVDILIC